MVREETARVLGQGYPHPAFENTTLILSKQTINIIGWLYSQGLVVESRVRINTNPTYYIRVSIYRHANIFVNNYIYIIISRELHNYVYIYTYGLCLWLLIGQSCTSHPPLGLSTFFSLIGGQRLEQLRGTRGTQLTAPGSVAPGDSPGMKDVFYRYRGDQVKRWDIWCKVLSRMYLLCVISIQTSFFIFALQASVPCFTLICSSRHLSKRLNTSRRSCSHIAIKSP